MIVKEEKNKLLINELDNAKIIINHQKEKLKSLDLRNEVKEIDVQNRINYKDR